MYNATVEYLLAIRQELAGFDEAISDTTVVSHLPRTVPDSFATTVGILKHKSPEEQTLDSTSAALIEKRPRLHSGIPKSAQPLIPRARLLLEPRWQQWFSDVVDMADVAGTADGNLMLTREKLS